MGEVSIEQRFHGTVVLTILHLRRIAKSNDIEEGFAAARDLKMLAPEHEQFIRECLALDARQQAGEGLKEIDGSASPQDSASLGASEASEGYGVAGDSITMDLVNELQACVLRLNSADPA